MLPRDRKIGATRLFQSRLGRPAADRAGERQTGRNRPPARCRGTRAAPGPAPRRAALGAPARESLQRAGGDFHLLAGFHRGVHGDRFRGPSSLRSRISRRSSSTKRSGTSGTWSRKWTRPRHSLRITHRTGHVGQVKARQQVAGEQGLDPPDLAPAGRLAVAQPRAQHLDSLQFAQPCRGDMLTLGRGAHAVPRDARLRVGLAGPVVTHSPKQLLQHRQHHPAATEP